MIIDTTNKKDDLDIKIITKIKPDRWKVQHPNGSWTTHESLEEAEEYELPVFEEIEPF